MGWAFDLDGVIWRANEPIAGSAEAIATLGRAGHEVVFVTNNSMLEVRDVEEKLARHGIDGRGRVITSAVAAAQLIEPHTRVLVCAGPGAREAVEARGALVVVEGPADVVMVGYHPEFDYARMTAAARAVWAGARLIGTNDDPSYPTATGLVPGGGAILASIAVATGVVPEVAGKPYAPMVELVRQRCGPVGIMVGDRADTDGLFAVALGYRFALVLSGVTTLSDLPVVPTPDVVAADAAEVVARAAELQ